MPNKHPITAGLKPEQSLIEQGYRYIVGIDEAGRGAWAGSVYAGAVCLPLDDANLSINLAGVRDSKQMSSRARSLRISNVQLYAHAWGVGAASAQEIDALGIVPATCLAMRRALDALISTASIQPDFLLLDLIKCHNIDTWGYPYQTMPKGDQHSLSIASASVLAKVSRDNHMREMQLIYPQYDFAIHKGYGTTRHRTALDAYGTCAIHRKSFSPCKPR